ncbi:MAG: hypothetical protein KDC38_15325 [Planctomycetes bacterium]|nr:hypothetical protein [Planctomycetota bacterium]
MNRRTALRTLFPLARSCSVLRRFGRPSASRAIPFVAALMVWGLAALVADPVVAQGERFPLLGRIKGDSVNIRAGASKNHRIVSQLESNSEIIVTGSKGEWVSFHLPPYECCWIHSDYVKPLGDDRMEVTGISVNLRATPNTTYSVIGQVGGNVVLRGSGRRSADGKWIEIFAPLEAIAWVHRDFVDIQGPIPIQDVPSRFAQLRPGSGRPAGGTPVGSSGRDAEPNPAEQKQGQPDLPSTVSARMRGIYAEWKQELQKPPITWVFSGLLDQLEGIATGSEDQGEVALARAWSKYIQDYHLPVVRGLVEDEHKRQLAREREAAGERQEKDAPKAITDRPKAGEKYLAKGWVFAMGTNSKVKGTHKLMKGNKLLFYLNSDSLDLDKYVYKRIGVQGILEDLPKDAGARLIRVTAVDVLSN